MSKRMKLENLFRGAALEMLSAFEKSKTAIRPDEIGGPREAQIRAFLKEWMPNKFDFPKGYLINNEKEISKECDIIIVDTDCHKFVMDNENNLRMVAENQVYSTIEVKSILDDSQLKNTIEKVNSVNNISTHNNYTFNKWESQVQFIKENNKVDYNYNTINPFENYTRIFKNKWKGFDVKIQKIPELITPPITILFAYGLNEKLTLELVESELKEKECSLDIVCILNKGVLIKYSEENLKRYLSMTIGKSKATMKAFGYNNQYVNIKSEFQDGDYIIIESNEESENLFTFHTILMDSLKSKELVETYSPIDLLGVWKK